MQNSYQAQDILRREWSKWHTTWHQQQTTTFRCTRSYLGCPPIDCKFVDHRLLLSTNRCTNRIPAALARTYSCASVWVAKKNTNSDGAAKKEVERRGGRNKFCQDRRKNLPTWLGQREALYRGRSSTSVATRRRQDRLKGGLRLLCDGACLQNPVDSPQLTRHCLSRVLARPYFFPLSYVHMRNSRRAPLVCFIPRPVFYPHRECLLIVSTTRWLLIRVLEQAVRQSPKQPFNSVKFELLIDFH